MAENPEEQPHTTITAFAATPQAGSGRSSGLMKYVSVAYLRVLCELAFLYSHGFPVDGLLHLLFGTLRATYNITRVDVMV